MTIKENLLNAPATDAQKAMIAKLVKLKATAANPILSAEQIANLKKTEIDGLKNMIFQLPWPAKKEAVTSSTTEPVVKKYDEYTDVVDGNYAYIYNGKTHFYRVTRETAKYGKWAGKTFIKVQERASDQLFKIYDYKMKQAILSEIRKFGISESQKFFAEKLGRCWRCGKTLTDDFNPYKDQGLGPDCGTKV